MPKLTMTPRRFLALVAITLGLLTLDTAKVVYFIRFGG